MSARPRLCARQMPSWQTLSPPDRKANVLTIAASLPFAETFARGLVARLGAERDPLAPSTSPMRRRLLLATLVKRWDETRRQGTLGFAQASALAGSLASLMDEME